MATYFAKRNPKDGSMISTIGVGLGIGILAGLLIKRYMNKQSALAVSNSALLGIGPHMNMPGEFAGPQPGLAAGGSQMNSMEFPHMAQMSQAMEFPGKTMASGMANVHDLRPAHNMNHEHGMTGFIGW
jgi:hypothetical protein